MKLIEVSIKPLSGFATPLKGDTLFGHFCWQLAHDPTLIDGGLDKWINLYNEEPFIVFSSAYFTFGSDSTKKCALPKPEIPAGYFILIKGQNQASVFDEIKELKKKKWLKVDGDFKIAVTRERLLTDEELLNNIYESTSNGTFQSEAGAPPLPVRHLIQQHNSINRLTFSTGTESMFAPFALDADYYHPGIELSILVLFQENTLDIRSIEKCMKLIGRWGYGKDASTGKGRFEVTGIREIAYPAVTAPNACFTLGPAVPEKNMFKQIFFKPFTRFGKHGDSLARSFNPFKCPVIMADDSAVLWPEDGSVFEKPYLGCAVTGISKALPQTVQQGYSIYLPMKLEKFHV